MSYLLNLEILYKKDFVQNFCKYSKIRHFTLKGCQTLKYTEVVEFKSNFRNSSKTSVCNAAPLSISHITDIDKNNT